jgi:hypothetical protein
MRPQPSINAQHRVLRLRQVVVCPAAGGGPNDGAGVCGEVVVWLDEQPDAGRERAAQQQQLCCNGNGETRKAHRPISCCQDL